jgi:hypothetical protein
VRETNVVCPCPHNIISGRLSARNQNQNMKDFKLKQHQMREKVALLNDTALYLQERGLMKEAEFHFSEAYRVLTELVAEYPATTSKRLVPLTDQKPRLISSSIGASSYTSRLAHPIFVHDLALESTGVPIMAVVLMYNTGLFELRRGDLKKADTLLSMAYSIVESYYKEDLGDRCHFIVEVTIVILDLLGRVSICRASHACCEQHKKMRISDGLYYHMQAVELSKKRLGAQHVIVGVCLVAFAADLARTGYLSEAMNGFTESYHVLTAPRSVSEYLKEELESQDLYPAAEAA